MPENRKFNEYLEAKEALKAKLAKAGITEEGYLDLFNLLDAVTSTDLHTVRAEQFADDAYDLAVILQVASASGKKQQQIGAFLRRFAEHVVRHACHIDDAAKISDIVDHLPQMADESEENSDER